MVEDKLAEDGVKDSDCHAVVDAIAAFVTPAASVYASGVDIDAIRKALTAERALPDSADLAARRDANRASAQALLGWRVLEVDEPAATRLDAMKMFTSAWGRVAATYKAKGGRVMTLRAAPLPKGSPLPKEAQHFAIEVPLPDPIAPEAPKGAAKPAPARPMPLELFVVPDGARTWIGVGSDVALVSARLQAAAAGTGDGLRGRSELAGMKDASVGSGGFFTARGLPEVAEQLTVFGADPEVGGGIEVFDEVTQLPHQGTTPIPFSMTAPASSPGTVVTTLQVTRGTIDDLLVSALKHGI